MSINYKFNQYRVSGEKAEAWSPMAYKLINKNVASDTVNGFKVGNILYLHYLKGMTAQEIRKTSVGYGIPTNTIKSIIRGFGRQSNVESYEAYEVAMYMIEHEPEVLEQMYQVTEYNR